MSSESGAIAFKSNATILVSGKEVLTRVYLFNGPPGSGKDTAVEYLTRTYPITGEKFALPIYMGVSAFLNITPQQLAMRKELPIFPGQRGSMTHRQLMIEFSERFIKPTFSPTIFGDLLLERFLTAIHGNMSLIQAQINALEDSSTFEEVKIAAAVAISDCGFTEEVQALLKVLPPEAFTVIYLHREGCSYRGDSRDWLDARFLGIESVHHVRNEGSVERLYRSLDFIVTETTDGSL